MSARDDIVAALRFLPQGTKEWEYHTKGSERLFELTASVVPNVVGVGYVSPYTQWQYDIGVKRPDPEGLTAVLQQRGREDEDAVVQRFVDWWATTAQRPLAVYKTGTWQHPRYSWLAASPDRYLYDIEMNDVYLLEAKSRQQDRDAMPPSDGHYTQCQVQLECIPEARGLFYVSANVRSTITDTPTVICAVTRHAPFMREQVLPKLLHYRSLVSSKTAPPLRQSSKPQFLEYQAVSVERVYPQTLI